LASNLDRLGELYYLAGKYQEAEPPLKESLAIRKDLFGSDHIETAESHNHLGVLYTLKGSYEKAESHLNDAIRIRKQSLGENHPSVAESQVNLASSTLSRIVGTTPSLF
jgi:tetratricopeptide (TPR) repeat protein